MAINRLAGQMLRPNLLRDSEDLAFDTDLLLLDVGNRRIGINATAPTHSLTVDGNAQIGTVVIDGNDISTDGVLSFTPTNYVQVSYATPNTIAYFGEFSNLTSATGIEFDGVTLTVPGGAVLGDITIDGNSIVGTGNISIQTPSGSVFIDDIVIDGTNISSVSGNVSISAFDFVVFNGTDGVVLPVGITAERPILPPEGLIRFNSETNSVEVWTTIGWQVVGPTYTTIESQRISGDGSSSVFVLDREASADSIYVSINGIAQIPNESYTVVTDSLTFTQAPEIGDEVEIRFLAVAYDISAVVADPVIDGGTF